MTAQEAEEKVIAFLEARKGGEFKVKSPNRAITELVKAARLKCSNQTTSYVTMKLERDGIVERPRNDAGYTVAYRLVPETTEDPQNNSDSPDGIAEENGVVGELANEFEPIFTGLMAKVAEVYKENAILKAQVSNLSDQLAEIAKLAIH